MFQPLIDARYLQLAIFASLLHHNDVAIAMFQPIIDARYLHLVILASLSRGICNR